MKALAQIRKTLYSDRLGDRAKRGSLLTILNFGASNALRLGSNLILTRLLFPEAFGLMALIQVVTGLIQMFSDIGLNASLVRHKRGDDPDFIDTVWTLQVIRGVLLWVAIAAASPLAAQFYEEPQLGQLLPAAALSALIAGFTPTSIITANRHLRLGRVTALGIGNQTFNLVITGVLAWWLQSVWALVWGMVIGALVRNITIRLIMGGHRNRFRLERQAVRDVINFGVFIFLGTVTGFLVSNVDRAILGKFVSVDLLGVYVIALTFANLPVQLVRDMTWKIVFPIYSQRPPQESAENRAKISRARHTLTIGTLIAAGAFLTIGDPLMGFLYPGNFQAAGEMAILVTLGALPALVITTYDPLLLAVGRSDWHALIVTVHAALKTTILFFAIAQYGIFGAALAPLLSTLLYYPLLAWSMTRWKAWDARHDAIYFAVAIVIGVWGWWINADAIARVVTM